MPVQPVLVQSVIALHRTAADRAAFLEAMREVRGVRQRSGAIAWRLAEDIAHPERFVEVWTMESWTDHLREEERLTPDDAAILSRAAAMHRAQAGPETGRYLNVEP